MAVTGRGGINSCTSGAWRRLGALAIWVWATAAAAAGLTLTEAGRPLAQVVVDETATELEKEAAAELVSYVARITGATLPMVAAPGNGPGVIVGRSRFLEALAPDVAWDGLGPDGIVVRTVGDRLLLAGGRPRGTVYAVASFLQDTLGVRWWAPDAESVPRQPTLRIPELNTVYRPPFELRCHHSAPFRDKTFARRLRQSFGINFDPGTHSIGKLLPGNTHFVAHPDWFMYSPDDGDLKDKYSYASGLGYLQDGDDEAMAQVAEKQRRLPYQPCLSNAAGRAAIGDAVLAQLATEYPKWEAPPKVVWVTQADGRWMCRCPECTAVREREGAQSALWVMALNEIGARLEPLYPDVRVGMFAYLHTMQAPRTVRPRSNVLVYMAFLDRDHKEPIPAISSLRAAVTDWSEMAEHVYVWDYTANFRNFIKPHPNHFVLAESIRFYNDQGADGLFVQGSWGTAGEFMRLRAWLAARLMWEPGLDARQLAEEFMAGYYGPAGPVLLQYIDMLNAAVRRDGGRFLSCFATSTAHWLTMADLNRATELFERAGAAVAGDEILTRRVRRTRLGLDMVWLERYRDLRREAHRGALPFRGPADPFAAVAALANDPFQVNAYREWADFSEYTRTLQDLFPPRPGSPPPECAELEPGAWEEIQAARLTASPTSAAATMVDDDAASDKRALRLRGTASELEAAFEVPAHLAGRWHVFVRLRALPATPEPAALVAGVYARDAATDTVNEVARAVVEIGPEPGAGYRTIDLGVCTLGPGSSIWVRPNESGSHGRLRATWIDRMFLVLPD